MRLLPALLLLSVTICATACTPKIGEGKSAEECADDVDNDDDGAIDCADAGCAGYSVCGGDSGDTTDDTEDPDDTDDPGGDPVEDPDIIINEFMASNATSLEDAEYPGSYPDWIELYNASDDVVDLEGYAITDDLGEWDKHILPSMVIEAGSYLILFADADPKEGDNHLPFALDKDGEELGLYQPDAGALTKLEFGTQVTDWSATRVTDGSETWDFDDTPTPGEANEL